MTATLADITSKGDLKIAALVLFGLCCIVWLIKAIK